MIYRFLGDIHGHTLALKAAYDLGGFDVLVQVGDFGFSSSLLTLNDYDPNKVKVVGGNHDEYPFLVTYPHYLGDYGTISGSDIFFVRGAYSIDIMFRTPSVDWWADEELGYKAQEDAVAAYELAKPEIMVSHDAPDIVTERWYHRKIASSTGSMLSHMQYLHKPKVWIFGHHHKHEIMEIDGTTFVALGIDRFVDLEIEKGKITLIDP